MEDNVIQILEDEDDVVVVKDIPAKKVIKHYQTSLSDVKIKDLICQLDNTSDLSVLPNFTVAQYTYLLDNKMLISHDGSDLHKLATIMR